MKVFVKGATLVWMQCSNAAQRESLNTKLFGIRQGRFPTNSGEPQRVLINQMGSILRQRTIMRAAS